MKEKEIMAKTKRTVIGSVLRHKDDPKKSYIKIKNEVRLKAGQILQLQSKKQQLDNLRVAVESGKMSADMASEIGERLERVPDFVLFEVIALENA